MNRVVAFGKALNALAFVAPKRAGRIALKLFMRPRRIALSPSEAETLAKAERITHPFGKGLVGYRFEASNPASCRGKVLLLHGWESNAGRWAPMLEGLLSAGYACTALDGPAAGESGGKETPFNLYVQATRAFAKTFGPFDVVIGHSLGGAVGIQLLKSLSKDLRAKQAVVMGSFDESEHVFNRYFAMLNYSRRVRKAFYDQLVDTLGKYTPGDRVRDYSNVLAARQLGDVQGLIVHSKDDQVAPYVESERLAEAWPGSDLLLYSKEGHSLKSSRVIADVLAWLQEGS